MRHEAECTAWMRLGLDGDEVAYRQLLESLGGGLRATISYRFAQAGLGNSDVEDVVQETLLALHLKRHTWNRSERLGPWVAAIARNKLIDAFRRRGRHNIVPIDAIEETLFATSGEAEETRGDVDTILEQLNERQRTIVRLVSLEGQSFRQVGQSLQMTEVAVRVSLHRTLKALAALYRSDPT
ncbi:MAG: sigma-70 family RNA polymerase sigma factor [Burkholderiaceae bacterium]